MIRRSAAGLAAAWLVGLALGFLDAFLEPLRKRHAALADLLLLPAAFRGWLEISFRVCRGGHPHELHPGDTPGSYGGEMGIRLAAGRSVPGHLDAFGADFWHAPGHAEKNFQKSRGNPKKSICIREKIGYNSRRKTSGTTAGKRRERPWQRKQKAGWFSSAAHWGPGSPCW